MTIKTFEIDYKGKQETIEYDDDIPFGELEQTIKVCVDITKFPKLDVNMAEYRKQIALKAIKKAPWQIQNVTELNKQGRKVMAKVMKEVMADYPLALSLEEWMDTFIGSEEQMKSLMESMPTVRPDLDGPKKKQTNTAPNS